MQKWFVVSLALLALVSADTCPDGGICETGHTCCNAPARSYGCCPMQQAECCEDHIHCCPERTLCMMGESRCVNETVSVPWTDRIPAKSSAFLKSFRMIKSYKGEDDDNICPDQSRCPSEFSCVKSLTRFGCCPLTQGVACLDGKHCCPKGHQCSADSRSCIELKEPINAVLCNDGVSECPKETTCCQSVDGTWGCCPMPKAVCCNDKTHCCPEGSTCDVLHSKCISLSNYKVFPMWAKFPARKREQWENQKDGTQLAAHRISDQAGNAPEGTTAITPPPSMTEEVFTSPVARAVGNDVPCDDKVSCEDGTTCCKTKEGGWACCPLPKAVCCDDFIHCCPEGTTCNLPAQSCDSDFGSKPWVQKVPALSKINEIKEGNDVPCDDKVSCEDGTTCCKTKEGGWACCPLPKAVCCDDFIHCCPEGTTCNLPAQSCDSDFGSEPWVQKVPVLSKINEIKEGEICDFAHNCSNDSTCCMKNPGDWACCPLREAVCCPDLKHCCPKGTFCDLTGLTCHSTSGLVVMEKEEEPAVTTMVPVYTEASTQSQPQTTYAMELQTGETDDNNDGQETVGDGQGNIQCDSTTTCPSYATCCFMSSSQKWGCCPLPKAVCCADGIHCCPVQYTCNVSSKTCCKGDVVIPWYNKLSAADVARDTLNSAGCDAQSKCPEGSSCCQLSTGESGCCPLKEVNPESQERNVKCDDQASCNDGETCCRTSATTWGCCPSPNAVCCSDMKHCCPSGSICREGGMCIQNTGLSWDNWQMYFSNRRTAQFV